MKKILLLSLFVILISNQLFACTGILLKTLGDRFICGRTMEFGNDIHSNILFIPREYGLKALGPTGEENGLTWKAKYAAVGANAYNLPTIVDGINEQGLASGAFYFPNYAKYQEVPEGKEAESLPMWELVTWILTNFANVQEVKEALPKIFVSDAKIEGYEHIQMPLHLVVYDAAGNSLVIEYIDGKLTMFDNPIGTITNSPTFDWHLINLSNYVNLTTANAQSKNLNGFIVAPFGQGSGMLGVPGDFTPPSRFVRATYLALGAKPLETEKETVELAFHVLNNFDIPRGVIQQIKGEQGEFEYTQWTSVKDLQNRRYYWHTYENQQVHMVDLMQLHLDAKETKSIAMHEPAVVVDDSAKIIAR